MTQEITTQVRFWGGLDTIGGNIVSLEAGNYRILTDFGALFGASLDELKQVDLTPSLLEKGHLPAIDGLYTRQQLGASDLASYEETDIKTIVCLSHLHLDHIGGFGQLPEDLPIYALEDSVSFYQRLASDDLLPDFKVNWQAVQSEEPFQFGPFTIEFVVSDHDTIGAASIFITGPDLKVVNSGDFRLTGFHPERVLHWAQKARDFQPDLFLVEGTTFSFDPGSRDDRMQLPEDLAARVASISAGNEAKFLKDFTQVVEQAGNQLVALNVYPQNIERLVYMAQALNRAGRTLVLEPNYYRLLRPYMAPEAALATINWDGDSKLPAQDILTWDQVQAAPAQYAVQVDYEQHHDYIFSLSEGIYIHSNGVPLGAYDARYQPWLEGIVKAGWQFYHGHVSGHASTQDLCLVNYVVGAKLVVPWHSFKPERYAEALIDLGLTPWLPSLDTTYSADQIKSLAD